MDQGNKALKPNERSLMIPKFGKWTQALCTFPNVLIRVPFVHSQNGILVLMLLMRAKLLRCSGSRCLLSVEA